ncbi:MAG: acyl carrier protein [Nonomuraea sp.]|nr:acyl carrier protein [Nonomuraea sp.]
MPDTTTLEAAAVPAVIRHVVRLIAPDRPAAVTDADQLVTDLGFHSLLLAELGFTLEELFELDAITPEHAMTLHTVGDIGTLITAAVDAGDASPPSAADVHAFSARYGQVWPSPEPGDLP